MDSCCSPAEAQGGGVCSCRVNWCDIGAEESVLPGKAFIVDLFQGLEMILPTLIKGSGLRFRCAVGCGLRRGMGWGKHAP
jgi:hypothetical protein